MQDGTRSMVFSGNAAFVAPSRGQYILRLEFSAGDPARLAGSERWLEDRVGDVRLVFTGPDGAIYFCTEEAVGRLKDEG